MLEPVARGFFVTLLLATACGDPTESASPGGGGAASGGSAGVAGSAGSPTAAAGSGGSSGAGGTAQAQAGGGAGGMANGGGGQGGGGGGGTTAGGGGTGGSVGAGGSVNNLPADYQGTPFAALTIPGKVNTCDYDRGGAGVAWCHDLGNCSAGTVTGDYPGGTPPYRPPMPANAQLCSGAACDDNVGVCHMNPSKPDNTITGEPMPSADTYLCYSVAGEWTKYTVHVAEAGTYSVSCVMGVQVAGAGFNLSFGSNITTGDIAVTATPTANSGSGEGFHSWDDRKNLGTVSFPAAGTYLMTFTQVSRINASSFTFTKM